MIAALFYGIGMAVVDSDCGMYNNHDAYVSFAYSHHEEMAALCYSPKRFDSRITLNGHYGNLYTYT